MKPKHRTEKTQRARMSLTAITIFVPSFGFFALGISIRVFEKARVRDRGRQSESYERNPTHQEVDRGFRGGALISAGAQSSLFSVEKETAGERKETLSAQTKAQLGWSLFTSYGAGSTRTRRIIQAFLPGRL